MWYQVSAAEVAKELLGETCYVGWPHMVEALVLGVCDGTKKYVQLTIIVLVTIEFTREKKNTGHMFGAECHNHNPH